MNSQILPEGAAVKGEYRGNPYSGRIVRSRTHFADSSAALHTVELDSPIYVYGWVMTTITLSSKDKQNCTIEAA